MEKDVRFGFREALSVTAWSFRCAYRIDGACLILTMAIYAAASFLPALLLGLNGRIVDQVAQSISAAVNGGSGLAVRATLEGVLPLLGLASLCLFGASLYYMSQNLLGQFLQARFDKGSFRMMIDELTKVNLRWFDDPDFVTQLELYQSSQNITWFVWSVVRACGACGAAISMLAVAASVSMAVFLPLAALSLLFAVIAVRNSSLEFKHWSDEGESRKRQSYYRTVLTAPWYAKDIRVLSAGPGILRLWRGETAAALDRRRRQDGREARSWDALRALSLLLQGVILGIALFLLYRSRISLGQLMTLMGLALSLPGTLISLGFELFRPFFSVRQNRHFKRFFERDWSASEPGLLGDSGRVAVAAPVDQPGVPDEEEIFRLEQVSYRYDGEHFALKDVSLTVRRGEIIALVGHNGAGKSTLTKILLGFYRPSSGRIFFRGKPYEPELIKSLPGQIGASFQDFRRFELSLRENVAFGDIACLRDDASLRRGLLTGGGQSILDKAQDDLDRYVGKWYTDDGLDLSGGEWQRLTTCRAYVNERPVFVMDEPASMLDPIAEIKQFEALRNNLGQRSAILVSHRIGFARLANRIAVLDAGRLVELGTHEGLMAKKAHYYRLFTAQAEWYGPRDPALAGSEAPEVGR